MNRPGEPWTGGTDMEGGTYYPEAGNEKGNGACSERERAASILDLLLDYATQDPIEPPFSRNCVNEALITWWAVMSECFGEVPPRPEMTKEETEILRTFLLETDTEQMIRRTYKKVAAIMDVYDLQAAVTVLRGFKILAKAALVSGRTYAELGEVDSETLIVTEGDLTRIFGLRVVPPGQAGLGPMTNESEANKI